jgi:ElaB/YqjD/DUF883 family membrane-anchored ribosome-binding protein
MPNAKTASPEIEDLKEDIASLKAHLETLSNSAKKNGLDEAEKLGDRAKEKLHELKSRGQDGIRKVEGQVKEKPGQSLAIAFAAGFLASMVVLRAKS